MPLLPSGLRLAVDSGLLDQLFADAQAGVGSSIPEVFAITQPSDLEAYLRFIWLENDPSPSAKPPTLFPYSLPLAGPVKAVLSGFRVADWDVFSSTLSALDAEAAWEFINSERHQQMRGELLAEVVRMQEALLIHSLSDVKIQAQWAKMGVHPSQTGENNQGLWEGAFDALLPPDQNFLQAEGETERRPQGHGDHWGAVGLSEQGILDMVASALNCSTASGDFQPPWEGDPMHRCFSCYTTSADLAICTIIGQAEPDAAGEVLSAYPLPCRTAPWPVRISGMTDIYGAFEAVVTGSAPDGGSLQWFAPRFGLEVETWRQCAEAGEAMVEMAGLALGMSAYPADPIVIEEGPIVEMRREELRTEGRHDEADDPDLSVTFITTSMRSIFSTYEDHCEYVGKILFVDEVQVEGLPKGWWVQLECLPEADAPRVRSLPVFVFPPALEDSYQPRVGDLVCGVMWLQGSNPLPLQCEV